MSEKKNRILVSLLVRSMIIKNLALGHIHVIIICSGAERKKTRKYTQAHIQFYFIK